MLEFLTLKPEAFGLDISDLSLKIIKLKKKGKFLSLASFGEFKIRPGIIKQGEIKDEKSLVKIIKNAVLKVNGEKLKTNYVIGSLPEEKAFLEVIQLPMMSEQDLKSAVIYEAENYIPLPIEQVYLDSQIVSPFHNHLDHFDVLIAALPRTTVDPYISCFKKAGLQPQVLEIESQAISRALIKNGVSSSPVLLIDLGASRTSFIIFSGYSLRFTSSVSVSSKKFTESISKTLKIGLKEAEKLKFKYGIQNGPKKTAKKVFKAMSPDLSNLVQEIKKYLDYYQSHAGHEHLSSNKKGVEKVFLSGGGANLMNLADFLSSELKMPVEIGNPWINILPKPLKQVPELPFKKSLCYTTALGLALRGIKYD